MSVKTGFRFDAALVADEWIDDVVITVANGLIESIQSYAAGDSLDATRIQGVALPGMTNVHSHAFQRGLAGLSEYRTAHRDSFWTWRNLMYDFLAHLEPPEVYRLAKQLYREMLRAGYTSVGEFHYLHNDKNGRPYSDPTEFSVAVTQAALDVGINFCLIPTLYQCGGFARPLDRKQQRFFLTEDAFHELIRQCQHRFQTEPNFQIGMALHSLRAVEVSVGQRVVRQFRNDFSDRPIHMHVSEQLGEVDDCLAATGRRPVELLFDHFDVDDRWCLIHATHAQSQELKLIANSQAVIGLCPSTEGNLGDGIFSAAEFLELGGRWGIGTDSQIAINPAAELRLLEYGQRLSKRLRCVLGTESRSVGRNLFERVAAYGAQALGINAGEIAVGRRADLIVIDPTHPSIDGAARDRLLDRFVFCDFGNPVSRTMVGGVWADV